MTIIGKVSNVKTELQRSWDDIRSILGWCPLYEGVMAERDKDLLAEPVRFMRDMTQKNYKCKFCNVNRDGVHQDFCPGVSLKKKQRVNRSFVSREAKPAEYR